MSGKNYSHIIVNFISAAFFVAITAIFPLYITRTHYFTLTGDKTNFFMIITAIAAASLFLALFLTTKRFKVVDYFAKNEPKRPISVSEWALLAFILLALVSAIFSPFRETVWRGFAHNELQGRWEGFWAFLCYCVTFTITARFYRPRRLHLLVFACSAVLVCLYGVLQYLGFDILERSGFFVFAAGQAPLTATFRATLGNINVVAAYSAFIIVLFAALYSGEDSRLGFIYLAASTMGFIMLVITGEGGDSGRAGVLGAMVLTLPYWLSDRRRFGKILIAAGSWSAVYAANQGYLTFLQGRRLENFSYADQWFLTNFTPLFPPLFIALAIISIAAGLFLLFFQKKWPVRIMKIAGIVLLGAVLAGGLLFVEMAGRRLYNQPNNIIWQAREMMHGRMDDHFGSNRGWVWRNGLSVIPQNPLLGTGPDTFFYALGGRRLEPVPQPTPEDPLPGFLQPDGLQLEAIATTGTWFDKAHNVFLQIAVTMGIPALLAFLVFLGGLFIPALKKAFERPLLLAFGAASLSYLINSFFQVETPIDRPLLYIALGVMAVELWRGKIGADEKPPSLRA